MEKRVAVLPGEGQRPERPAGRRERKHQTPRANEAVARPGPEPGRLPNHNLPRLYSDSGLHCSAINTAESSKGLMKCAVLQWVKWQRMDRHRDAQQENQERKANNFEKQEQVIGTSLIVQ